MFPGRQAVAGDRVGSGIFGDGVKRPPGLAAIAFDDDPYELVSMFVAMAQGEWALRLALGQVSTVTDDMIAAHARRVSALFLKALAPDARRG